MFSLVSESRLCFQTGVKREKNGGKRDVKGCWEIAEGEYARIKRGKKWTWRRMARDSCKDEGRVGKKNEEAEDEREERNMLLPLSFMSRLHITRRVLLQLWHKTWLCYKGSHRHYELWRQLNCALPSLLLLSSSHPLILNHLITAANEDAGPLPSRLICNPLPRRHPSTHISLIFQL